MTLWSIPAFLIMGTAAVIAFAAFIFKDLDDMGEPREEDQW
ncbi:hypothetical protein [Halomonas sp. 707B3]|nr:hypothetical protein [Halomonas sp. 707B3]